MKQHVFFKNGPIDMAADLYLPEGFDDHASYPALVMVHPGGGVKEQVSGHYGALMAEHGFVALAFDASHQGESGGEPRYLEDPAQRVEDVRAAVDYLTTLAYVDSERIGAAGICAGGGYAVNAACTEHRIKAVATISAFDIGAAFRGEGMGMTPAQRAEQLAGVGAQRTAEAAGADSLYITYVPNSAEEIDENTSVLNREAYDYYRTPRAQHPRSTNQLLFSSIDRIMAFSAFGLVPELLTQPLLMIAGSEADTLAFSQQAVSMAQGEKELFLVDGATHIAMYDVSEYVEQAVAKLDAFFSAHLA